MTARTVPKRHWRSYGDHPLPTGAEAPREGSQRTGSPSADRSMAASTRPSTPLKCLSNVAATWEPHDRWM
jgi:hypothetical protein